MSTPTGYAGAGIATYTQDPERIEIIRQNIANGKAREELPSGTRARLDLDATFVTAEHLKELRRRVGYTD